jgi:hypothetical protein
MDVSRWFRVGRSRFKQPMKHPFAEDTPENIRGWDDCSVYPNQILPGSAEHAAAHARLFELAVGLPTDFEPYGQRDRSGWNCEDCSCGCRHFAILAGPLGQDWGACMNERPRRAGLLTFEHQGCPAFERGPEREPPGHLVTEE